MPGNPLPTDKLRVALERIAAWRAGPEGPVACPVCEKAGLVIVDQSARPYSEWYALSCRSCALQATIHIPMAPPMPSGH